jgi:predicted Zn-dependent peptidase
MRLKQLLLVAFLSVNTMVLLAQKYEWKQGTSGTYPYKYVTNDPMGARYYTLKNGLTVILSVNKKEPRISSRIAVRTGSNNDPKNHTGLAHYLEHLLFKGTDKYGSLDWAKEKPLLDKIDDLYEQYNSTKDEEKRKEIYKEIDKVSGEASKYSIANEYDKMMTSIGSQRTNAHTWVEETVYDEDIPSNAAEKYLQIQSERFRMPIFRIFHTELEAVYEEKNRSLDNDGWKIQEASHELLFPTHNYGQQTTIGTMEHLKNPSLKAIREYYYKYYVPNNMALVMAGDFNPDVMIKLVDKYMGYMKPKPVEAYKGPIEAPINGPVVKEIVGPSSETLRLFFRGPASGTKESTMLEVVSAILANGKAGLLDLNLNKQQLVLGAGAGYDQYKDYGVVTLLASPKEGQSLEEVKDLLLNQLEILKKGSFDESLIKAIVANYKLGQLQGLENNTTRTNGIVDSYIKHKGARWNDDVAQLDAMGKITKAEVVAFANQFFTDKNYVVIYKRKGEDDIVKVDKPIITPVETNAGKQSPFVKFITGTPLPTLKPMFIDYTKELQKTKLGNADVLYVQNKENGLFKLSYRFDMGNWNNKTLSAAAQYVNFLGTDKYTAEEISKEFYNLACNFNINVGNEETVVSLSGLNENFDKAVALLEHVLHNAKPDEAAMEGLKNRLMKSRANAKTSKGAISQALRNYALYGAENPFNYVLSNEEIQKLSASDLTNMLHSLMNYQHKITYYGPQTLPQVTAKLKKEHTMPTAWIKNPNAVKFTRLNQTGNQVLFADYDAVQAEIYWVKNLDNYDSKKEALVNFYNNYFGGGMGSIVFQTIRESKALAYSTYAYVVTPGKKDDSFSMVGYVGSQADKMNDAIVAMNELLDELPKTEQNLVAARKSLLKDIETDRITNDGIITSYLNAQRKGIDTDIRKDYYTQYANFKIDDIYNYHQNSFAKKPYTYCVVASDKKIKMNDLKKYGDLKVLSLEELFGY